MSQLLLGIEGYSLTADDCRRLTDERTAGVILFSRNYQSLSQLSALTTAIKQLRADLLISVDHEGGRVQRFREGFTALPAAACFSALFQEDSAAAIDLAKISGQVLASELLAYGVDLSYAPVLDLDYGVSAVIGDRSYGATPAMAIALTEAVMAGMNLAGMQAVGKHFPGHGGVEVDTHGAIAIDQRSLAALGDDLSVFKALIDKGLAAIMPAHVIYPHIDALPAGFSRIWLQDILLMIKHTIDNFFGHKSKPLN